ncbi:hypothetical protein LNV08_21950 [Paucibacter sp. TC2R-5]|uniref:HAD domain-containing protein n=1 Tax=Paucibacter sp. TC2R-5 TaxID=2893555 RepID=UPI002AA4B479|nr:hypothetical protein [Paucibacter sp. TC2R-5]
MLLFLDFDGVLHKYGCKPADLFTRLPLLEAWLQLHPGVDVVVSSTWRLTRSLDELRSHFSAGIRSRIVGVTPKLAGDSPERFSREAEVAMWLRQSALPWRPWAALEDQAWLYRPFNKRVVLCDPDTGLTKFDLDRLASLVAAVG